MGTTLRGGSLLMPELDSAPIPGSQPSGGLDLSIVIPAYNEERRLPRSLDRIQAWLAARSLASGAEILVVDDGSTDATPRLARESPAPGAPIRLISNGSNRGKGYSVRHGMLEARGCIGLFTDADLSAPIEEADKLLSALCDADVAIGSRAMNRKLIEIHQSRLREFAGIIFNRIVRLFTGLPIEDTQCGFKAFRSASCRPIFEQQRIEGFGFDPEILFIARNHGLRIAEVPVRWAHDPGTKVRVVRDSVVMFLDLWVVRWNWLLGRYRPSAPVRTSK
jgi:dolichyl-phosphate beta-glucosyltransferase